MGNVRNREISLSLSLSLSLSIPVRDPPQVQKHNTINKRMPTYSKRKQKQKALVFLKAFFQLSFARGLVSNQPGPPFIVFCLSSLATLPPKPPIDTTPVLQCSKLAVF